MGVTDYKLQHKKISKLEDTVNRNYPKWNTERKKTEKNEQGISELWDNFKCFNVHITGVLEGKKDRKIFEEITADCFHNLIKTTNPQLNKPRAEET